MNILFVASGFPPATFSENLCNGKLVLAFLKAGYQVDVVSRVDSMTYSNIWDEPWLSLRPITCELAYPLGSKIGRGLDVFASSLKMGTFPLDGVRWARRAYEKALAMHAEKRYDVVMTRSPNDISHLVGYKFSRKTGVKWVANWNDPASPIWPEPYGCPYHPRKRMQLMNQTAKFLRQASANTFPSVRLRDHFTSFFPFLKGKETYVIPHIGLLSELLPKGEPQMPSTQLRLCHSGNLSPERNPNLLFQAMRELIDEKCADFRLDIMGHTNAYTESLVCQYHLTDCVHFISGQPYMDALRQMGTYDVLVLLEAVMNEGIFFPSKFTDYAQLGKPILAVSPIHGFAHDVIAQFGGGLAVDNTNVEAIKSGLRALIQSWKCGRLTTDFDSRALYAGFSPDYVVTLYRDLFEALVR